MNANYRSIVLAIGLLFALSAFVSAAPGDLDPTFGNGGIVNTRGSFINYLDIASAVAIQSDGKIVVVGDGGGETFNNVAWGFAVVRYNPDGSLDSSFGGTGRVITQLTDDYDGAAAVAIQADGKIVVAGSRYNCFCIDSSFAVVRYNPNGSLDTSFNNTGIVITSVASPRDYAQSVAIQVDGKIVVAGSSGNGNLAIVRYNSNGSLDATFNGTGKVITQAGGGANAVALQADGKIVAAGESRTLVRYNPNGSLDTSFNSTGKVITSDLIPSDLAIQTDGKIVVAGSGGGAATGFIVARYNADGTLDTSFGDAGKTTVPIGSSGAYAHSVAIQPNGKIVVVGSASADNNTGSDFAVVRVNPNGSPDATFNGTGKVITPIASDGFLEWASGVAIQTDGKIVVAGSTDNGFFDFYDFAVVRYQGDGDGKSPNPIEAAQFFVRQHYLDFLGREPDAAGLAFWTGEIESCGADAQCREVRRINVSAAFFLSIEYQETGYLTHRAYKAAYGDLSGKPVPLTLQEFLAGGRSIGDGVRVGVGDWQQQLEANKVAFFLGFVTTPRFLSLYPPGMDNGAFVDALNQNAGGALSGAERDALVAALNGGTISRALALRRVAEDADFAQGPEKNRAFVLSQYFGYLRRNPDDLDFQGQPDPGFLGYGFWLAKLEEFDGDFVRAEMVRAFIESIEYRQRFGQ